MQFSVPKMTAIEVKIKQKFYYQDVSAVRIDIPAPYKLNGLVRKGGRGENCVLSPVYYF